MKNLVLLIATLVAIGCNNAQEKVSATALLISDVNIVNVRTGDIM